ncbi:glycosyltransferase family 2 protein [Psychrobacter sp. 1Y11]|uniref:glycosyltransferase family 2 protein n=1 Tax=Psychrobacter sp. 1Y11 TaxID=3457446 RepID=UPI003FD0B0F6
MNTNVDSSQIKDINLSPPEPKSEAEIMAHWQESYTVPLVSVVCITYNHEPYIRDALNGFLMQKTDYPFEVLIHDDASRDNTADIIRDYEQRYPHIIKPIYQTENQYSKGIKISPTFNFPRAQGDYIALCEGDDFWTCRDKLNRQVLFLRTNPKIFLSIHRAYICMDNQITEISTSHGESETVLPSKLVYTTAGQFCPTASMVIAREKVAVMPEFFDRVPIGDFFLEAMTAIGGVHYLPEACSVYRLGSRGSWTNRVVSDDEKFFKKSEKMLVSLKELEAYLQAPDSQYVHHKATAIHLNLANRYLQQGDFEKSRENWFASFKPIRRLQRTDIRLFLGLLRIRF